jgi:hypothetical protein
MADKMKQLMFHTFALHESNFSQIDAHKETLYEMFTKPLDMIIDSSS